MFQSLKEILIIGDTEHGEIGIAKTPCYPAEWYAGLMLKDSKGEWYTAKNDTHFFHRTRNGALKAAHTLLKFYSKGV